MLFALLACAGPDPTGPGPTDGPAPTETGTGPTDSETGSTGDTAGSCPECDDGFGCTRDTCDPVTGACEHEPIGLCPWPATAVTYLAVDPALGTGQSGAAFDAATGRLWIVGGSNGRSTVHRLLDGPTGWVLDVAGGEPARWVQDGIDLEDAALVDPAAPNVLYAVSEGDDAVVALDLSAGGTIVGVQSWNIAAWVPAFANTLGSEGLAFAPDAVLADQGFTDADGLPVVSEGGLGGLLLVGHQNGGHVYAFDASPDGGIRLVGRYETQQGEISGMTLDGETGNLFLWHGGTNDLEIARLSSGAGQQGPKLDTVAVFDFPGAANIEGIALGPCDGGVRRLFLVEDDGGDQAVGVWADWPCL